MISFNSNQVVFCPCCGNEVTVYIKGCGAGRQWCNKCRAFISIKAEKSGMIFSVTIDHPDYLNREQYIGGL